jgi:hypothetical protein
MVIVSFVTGIVSTGWFGPTSAGFDGEFKFGALRAGE